MRSMSSLFEQSTYTTDMEKYFVERTKTHIDRVKKNGQRICDQHPDISKQLYNRLQIHDKSKFDRNEREGYIYLTTIYRPDVDFKYSEETLRKGKDATNHHYKYNRHHPEFHAKIENMTMIDIAEMVADWAAMSQEKGTSLHEWVYSTAYSKYNFTNQQKELIEKFMSYFPELR